MAVGYANQDKQRWLKLAALLLDGGLSGVAGLLGKLSVLAEGAVEASRFELSVHKPALAGLVALMLEASEELAALVKPLLPAAGGEDKGGDKDDKEERGKRQKEARERALAQMAEQQRAFAAMMDDSDDDNGGDDEMYYGEGPMRLGSSSQGDVATEDFQDEIGGQQCVLCHETADQTRPLGLICFAQASSVVSFAAGLRNTAEISPGNMPELVRDCALNEAVIDGYCFPYPRKNTPLLHLCFLKFCSALPTGEMLTHISHCRWERPGCERGHGVGVSFCGHAMHQDCLDRYMQSLELRLRTVDIGHGAVTFPKYLPCNAHVKRLAPGAFHPDSSHLLRSVCGRWGVSMPPVPGPRQCSRPHSSPGECGSIGGKGGECDGRGSQGLGVSVYQGAQGSGNSGR